MAISTSSIVQYAFIGIVAYLLLGAPLLKVLFGEKLQSFPVLDGKPVEISASKLKTLIIPDPLLECAEHKYTTRIFSRSPLVVYIENFVSDEERLHLMDISTPLYTPATLWSGDVESLNPAVRLSSKAQPPRTPTVRCIEQRARDFQGPRPFVFVERLWTQLYGLNGHYKHHYDWGHASVDHGRISSFMVYLDANCTGGGTEFPRLPRPKTGKDEWCRFIEYPDAKTEDEDDAEGVTWKAIAGNAVYWENFDEQGNGFEESWHAGMPVTQGTKTGLNIWSWYQRGWYPSEAERLIADISDGATENVSEKDEL